MSASLARRVSAAARYRACVIGGHRGCGSHVTHQGQALTLRALTVGGVDATAARSRRDHWRSGTPSSTRVELAAFVPAARGFVTAAPLDTLEGDDSDYTSAGDEYSDDSDGAYYTVPDGDGDAADGSVDVLHPDPTGGDRAAEVLQALSRDPHVVVTTAVRSPDSDSESEDGSDDSDSDDSERFADRHSSIDSPPAARNARRPHREGAPHLLTEHEAKRRSSGERISKRLARAGVASRRGAERLVRDGRVSVNGIRVASPAFNVLPEDSIELGGKPLRETAPHKRHAQVWIAYKLPLELVAAPGTDLQGRRSIFDRLRQMGVRPSGPVNDSSAQSTGGLIAVGRLDYQSEGLLLFTNDGDVAQYLMHPAARLQRVYRVRVRGKVTAKKVQALGKGLTVDGVTYQPVHVAVVDADTGNAAEAWLEMRVREGKNRELRRLLAHVGLKVQRLVRVQYGPYKLGRLPRGSALQVPLDAEIVRGMAEASQSQGAFGAAGAGGAGAHGGGASNKGSGKSWGNFTFGLAKRGPPRPRGRR